MVALGGFFVTLSQALLLFAIGTRLPSSYSSFRLACVQKRATRETRDVCTQATFFYLSFGKYANLPWPSLALCTDLT